MKTSALKNINIDKAILKIIDIIEEEDIYSNTNGKENDFHKVNSFRVNNQKDIYKYKDNATLEKEKCC